MTYCLGIKLRTGLVAIADTRLTSGTEVSTNKKVSIHEVENHSLFIMTSGLRSVRDKAITYFQEVIDADNATFDKLYKAVNAFGEQIRRVAAEDKDSLAESGLRFNLNAIVGGQLEKDGEHKLYRIYPEGNWVEILEGSPFVIIGNSGYGKPLLDRSITYETGLMEALKVGYLSFDATRVSANDVDFPLDVVLYPNNSFHMVEHRFQKDDLSEISAQWAALLKDSLRKLPETWLAPIEQQLPKKAEA
jgi:putative proteasome-type protease